MHIPHITERALPGRSKFHMVHARLVRNMEKSGMASRNYWSKKNTTRMEICPLIFALTFPSKMYLEVYNLQNIWAVECAACQFLCA